MFGVSPAYFVSRHTDRFTFGAIADDLPQLADMGFDAFQPEVFRPDDLEDWRCSGAARIARSAARSGLAASQVVGHCLWPAFESAPALASDWGLRQTADLLDGMRHLEACDLLTVVVPAFRPSAPSDLTVQAAQAQRAHLVDKLQRMLDLAERAGVRLALEILPGSLIGGTEGFLRLHDEIGRAELGCNLDTGHAWTMREWLPRVPALLGSRVFGTHLKDNHQDGAALAPGQGSIPWAETLAALHAAGYGGSLDLEFLCAADEAATAYARALRHLRAVVCNPGTFPRSQPC